MAGHAVRRLWSQDVGQQAWRMLSIRGGQTQAALAEDVDRQRTRGVLGTASAPSLAQYYSGKNLFMTGATGFCGKPIIEKLLRSCPDIQGIYCLTRPKKGVKSQDRLQDIFNDPLFETLKGLDREESFRHKVYAVEGDIGLENFGMSDKNSEMLKDRINIILHSAATINFNDPIDEAVNMNVLATRRVLDIARGVRNLEAHLHVSTAFAYSNKAWHNIKEDFYEHHTSYNKVIEEIRSTPKEQLKVLQSKVVGGYPNTYSTTKGMAEHLIAEEGGDLPIAIVRPSAVITTYQDPVPGWICSGAGHGLASILYWIGRGSMRAIEGMPDMALDIIPSDIVTNSALAAIWKTATSPSSSTKIYNVTSSSINPITMEQIERLSAKAYQEVPLTKADRQTVSPNWLASSRREYMIRNVATHWAPAIYRSMIGQLQGKKNKAIKIAKLHGLMNESLSFFLKNRFYFDTDNFRSLIQDMSPSDAKEFWFNPQDIDWTKAMTLYSLGIKKYIAKEALPEPLPPSLPVQQLGESHLYSPPQGSTLLV